MSADCIITIQTVSDEQTCLSHFLCFFHFIVQLQLELRLMEQTCDHYISRPTVTGNMTYVGSCDRCSTSEVGAWEIQ